jgi:hypothetical protein
VRKILNLLSSLTPPATQAIYIHAQVTIPAYFFHA